ncbi:MAG: FRG domain-containing protein [Bacteroidia bacterium]|nr:FRG domain-containing protein [Bacteroidia bacterium]
MWTEKTINDWSEFNKLALLYNPKKWIFRGQSNSKWDLSTSYKRSFEEIQKIYQVAERDEISHRDSFESVIIQQFKSQSHLYLDFKPETELEWLTVMQHYQTPTRLIDWTFSAYIALFFALNESNCESTVYALNQDRINKFYRIKNTGKEFKDSLFNDLRNKDAFVFAYEPQMKNERLVRQQGLFLVPSNNFETIDQIFERDKLLLDKTVAFKIIIPPKARFTGLKMLKKMNVSYETMFPGIEGFCKSLKLSLLDSSENLKRI